jgi:Flp pilus assembly secretin CpaC
MLLSMLQPRRPRASRSLTSQLTAAAVRVAVMGLAGLLAMIPVIAQSSGVTPAPGSMAPRAATAPPPPQPDKGRARNAFQAGRRAEQSSDWKAEFAAYTEAAGYDPSNREYAILKEHARFQVIQSLVDSAERQAIAGNIAGARALLSQALEIDPNYAVAQERLKELTPGPAEEDPQKGPRLAGLPRLTFKPGTHAFDYRGTTRGAYEELGAQFGVKMVFDGDLPDRAVRFQVPDLDFDTAVMVLSRQTRTFTRVVDAHTMFVTEDSAQKVRDYSLEVEKQLLLPAAVSSDELNEVVRMVREMTGITRTQLNAATRTLTVRSTEQNVALAQALVQQIEQPHGELMLDIDILELDRTAASQLGVTPPSTSSLFMLTLPEIRQLQAAQNSGTLIQTLQSIFGSSSVSSASGAALPALIAFGGGKTIFLATMPDFSANFGAALSTVQSARRVLLRAQDGKPATFFVGDRYPISLGLLSADLNPTSSALAAAVASGLASGLTFPRTDYNVGKTPVSVAIAVFNNKDNFFDLAVANQGDGTISILQGNGDGTFTIPTASCIPAPLTFPSCIQLPSVTFGRRTTAAAPSAIVTGDFDGDGNTDIAVTDKANGRVLILFGNGDGTFQTPFASYATGLNPVALVAQDFDGDGHPDLAVVNQGDNTVSVLLGTIVNTAQRVTFAPSPNQNPNPILVGASPSAIATGIFVTNKFPSLAVTNMGDNTVTILLGNGTNGIQDGTFTPVTSQTLTTGTSPAGIAVADFNNDGKTDLAVTYATDSSNNSVAIHLGNGDGTFGTAKNFPAGSGPVGIVAGAFAGTNSSLVVADETGNNADVLIGNGDGTFAAPISLPTGNGPVALATEDLNGDGTLDLVTANTTGAPTVASATGNTVTVTLNTSQSLGNSPSAQTAYPSAEYEDLGLKVKATPRLHANNEVTLQLEFDIKALTGSNINGIPVLSNRNIEQTIRLRENETSVLSGLLQSSEIRSTSGLPWLSTPPGIGLLTGEDTSNIQKSELLILVTPRALRLPPHDAPAIYAGRGEPNTPPSGPQTPPGVAPPAPAGAANPNPPPQGGRGPFGAGAPPNQPPGTVVQPQQPDQQQRLPPQQQ